MDYKKHIVKENRPLLALLALLVLFPAARDPIDNVVRAWLETPPEHVCDVPDVPIPDNEWAYERQTVAGGKDVFERCRDKTFCPVDFEDPDTLTNTNTAGQHGN